MLKKRVFITRSILLDGPELLRSKGFEVDMNLEDRPLSYNELMAKAKNYDALITMLGDQIDQNFLSNNSHLKVISNYAVGFNNIDLSTASALNIPIGNTPGVLTEATAEIALGLLISSSRLFNEAQFHANQGLWKTFNPTGFLGHSLKNKTLGVMGFGRIGMRLAEMASNAFQMKILYTANSEKSNSLGALRVPLDELLAQSDFVSIHLPLNEQTKKILSTREFNLMKKTSVLVNTARGEVIDQDALLSALQKGQIFAAGLDVTDPEPLPTEHALFKLKNVIILPHIGSATYEARRAMSILAAEKIIAGLNGEKGIDWVNKKNLLP